MTVKKLTKRQIKWFFILLKHDFVINYITSKNDERADVLWKLEQNVAGTGDDKLEYKMVQLLKPKILNFDIKPKILSKFNKLRPEKTELNFNQL